MSPPLSHSYLISASQFFSLFALFLSFSFFATAHAHAQPDQIQQQQQQQQPISDHADWATRHMAGQSPLPLPPLDPGGNYPPPPKKTPKNPNI